MVFAASLRPPLLLLRARNASCRLLGELLTRRRIQAPKQRASLATLIYRERKMAADRVPRTSRLDESLMASVRTAELNTLADMFAKHGYQLRIAGGAVRDMLCGVPPADVDLATTATPEQMLCMFAAEGVRVLHKAGEKHGTVACRIADRVNFEVTTLRIDLVCDGRRAEVEFTRHWPLDAERRDLTVNAMFADLDGTVYDYFDGMADLERRRVAFVGDGRQRIQEDYLRILRYFRFYGRLATQPCAHEPDTLAAIGENVNGLADISGERIWSELKKIAAGGHAGPLMRAMYECGVPAHCGLPPAAEAQLDEYERVALLTQDTSPMAMTRLAALLRDTGHIDAMHRRLKVSNAELNLVTFVVRHRLMFAGDAAASGDDMKRRCQELLLDLLFAKTPLALELCTELLKYAGEGALREHIAQWPVPVFPVNGLLLAKSGVRKGPRMRFVLAHLFDAWKASGCEADAEALLRRVDDPEIDRAFQEYESGRGKAGQKRTSPGGGGDSGKRNRVHSDR